MRFLLGIVLGVCVMAVLLREVSFEEFVEVARRGNVVLVVVCFSAGLIATIARALRYAQFFDYPGRLVCIYGVFATARLVSYLLPFRAGELALLGMLKKQGLAPTIAETTPVWLLLRLSDICTLAALSVICVGVFAVDSDLARASWILAAVAGACAVILVALGAWVVRSDSPERGSWWFERLESFRQGFQHLRDPLRVSKAAVLALVIWAAVALVATVVQIAFGSPLPLDRCFVVGLSVVVIALLPIHGPLGLGTYDASWAGSMILAGVEPGEAVALALCARLVLIAAVLLDAGLGAIALWNCAAERQGESVRNCTGQVSP